jgi:hypothetical protein
MVSLAIVVCAEQVVAIAAVQQVGASAAIEGVVAGQTLQRIVEVAAYQTVVAGCSQIATHVVISLNCVNPGGGYHATSVMILSIRHLSLQL